MYKFILYYGLQSLRVFQQQLNREKTPQEHQLSMEDSTTSTYGWIIPRNFSTLPLVSYFFLNRAGFSSILPRNFISISMKILF
jgi:hypothetical protein